MSSRVICKKYQLKTLIGKGSFGEVYEVEDTITHKLYAAKLEPAASLHQMLFLEARVLKNLQGMTGVPGLVSYGVDDQHNVLVMQLLGSSLQTLVEHSKGKFSLRTTMLLGEQLVHRLEALHNLSYIHRDIKPENFAVALDDPTLLFIFDFGLSKKYRDSSTHQHIPCRENKGLVGTAKFVSINTHMGMDQSRRDDLESLAYVLINFLKGALPWQNVTAQTSGEKNRRIMEVKLNMTAAVLCKDLPAEVANFLSYTKGLRFEEQPDYFFLRRLFRDVLIREKLQTELIFDWMSKDVQRLDSIKRSRGRHMGVQPSGQRQHTSNSSSNGSLKTQIGGTLPYFRQTTRNTIRRLTLERTQAKAARSSCALM